MEEAKRRFPPTGRRDGVYRVEFSMGDCSQDLEGKGAAPMGWASHSVALLDLAGNVLRINSAEEDGGCLWADALGRPLWEARCWSLSKTTIEQECEACRRAAVGETALFDVEVYRQAADEEKIIIEHSVTPLSDHRGGIAFLLAEGRDVTDERKAPEQTARRVRELEDLVAAFRQLDHVKSNFFFNISHDLRTPLTLIIGAVDLLRGSWGNMSSDQRCYVDVVQRNSQTLLKHVTDLLDLSRFDAGRMSVVYQRTDLAEIARSTAAHFEAMASERNIEFIIDAPDQLPIEADTEKIERVFLNLLGNAFKFSPSRGRIILSVVALSGGWSQVQVQDSGPGVPVALREIIFEPFRQGDDEASRVNRQARGTGLGLTISKDFVTLHGGSISVGEAAEGGAVFQFTLPLAAPAGIAVRHQTWELGRASADDRITGTLAGMATTPDDCHTEPVRPERPLALVVEDNRDLRLLIVGSLGDKFNVVTAGDGDIGVQKALEASPDVIITDLVMPRMSGERMVAAIRKEGTLADVPILVLSGIADESLRVRLLKAGAQDYVTKPVSADELRARAVNLCNLKRAREILQHELDSRNRDIAALAREVAESNRTLRTTCAEMRVAREQAEAASRMKSRFLGMVSHELRSPLQNFELYLALLRQAEPQVKTQQLSRVMGGLEEASRRMAQLVTSILHHSSIEGGNVAMQLQRVKIEDAIAEAVAEVRQRASAKGLALDVRGMEGKVLPPLETDPNLLHLVLVNLLDNAIKYTSHGSVTVTAAWADGWHYCTVADTGIGIRPEDQERVFEPFQQMEVVEHKHTPGVGLGLTLVKNIVALLGGTIELTSEPGRGSAFTVGLKS